MSKYRKELGHWGETQLDGWMVQWGWKAIEKNIRIPGGEIDRIYSKCDEQKQGLCIAEVKTNVVYSNKILNEIFTEVGIKRYLKQRQIRNLYRFGEVFLAKGHKHVFLRIFIILKMKKNMKINAGILPLHGPIKACAQTKEFLIFSIEPEFTMFQACKSMLQVKI